MAGSGTRATLHAPGDDPPSTRVTQATRLVLPAATVQVGAGIITALHAPAELRAIGGVPTSLLVSGFLLSMVIAPSPALDRSLRLVLSVALSLTCSMATGLLLAEIFSRVTPGGVGAAMILFGVLVGGTAYLRVRKTPDPPADARAPRQRIHPLAVVLIAASILAFAVAVVALVRAPGPGSRFVALRVERVAGRPEIVVANHTDAEQTFRLVITTEDGQQLLSRGIDVRPKETTAVTLPETPTVPPSQRVRAELQRPDGTVYRFVSFFP